MIRLIITDQNLGVRGDELTDWTSLDCTLRFNEPAAGTLVLPAYPEILAELQPGRRLVVIRDGEVWCAGPMEIPQDGDRTAANGVGTVTVSFTDDLGRIVGDITYPNPALPASDGAQPAERVMTATNTETMLRTLVNENVGAAALAARRIPGLTLGAVAGVGSVATFRTRFEPLGDALRTIAAMDGLGFRTRQVGKQILFEVYAPRDLSGIARFSEGLGNLRSLSYKISAPTCTHAIVGGGGEGADRVIVEVTDAAAESLWYRVVKFVDRRDVANDANGELTAAGQQALAEGAGPVELSTTTVDIPDDPVHGDGQIAGRDFGLGDRVTVELPTGVEVTDIVRAIHLQATPKAGELVTSTIGTAEATRDQRMVGIVYDLARRLGRLETR